ncbi:MAG: hypothetical protein JSU96_01340 [Acidobacteriota bacterium]|nr:MAG: hypothetical protein JSU96_01340 [Acidobacteriota bacterium]
MLRAVDRELYGGRAQYGRFITVADLRPNLGLVEEEVTLSSYFSMLRLGARLDGGSGMESLAEAVNGQVYEALRRGDQYSALLLSPMTMRLALRNSRERMADVALSFSGRSGLVEERSSFQLVDWRACVSNFPVGPPCTAQARVFGGRLKIDFLFLEPETEPALVKRVLERFEQELIQWLANSESAHGTNP